MYYIDTELSENTMTKLWWLLCTEGHVTSLNNSDLFSILYGRLWARPGDVCYIELLSEPYVHYVFIWVEQSLLSLFTERDGMINLDVLYVMSLNSCVSVSEMRCLHYSDVIMSAIASQNTGVSIVYSTIWSGTDQRKHQSSVSLAFVRGIHWWRANSSHKGSVMFPFDDVIVILALIHHSYAGWGTQSN